ncbi:MULTISPECIES: hypothetical protein [Janthinobacterium]|uniref:Lipoprotein n=1 Tax=Janthinobacterium rivuli TaxID=2751478 RepID=A0ABY8I2S8_9BURK|nr:MULTISPECIES: hypothetical protein [Janthinobacterium]MBW3508276.1 hypothetical protein [Janthinobacterium sp. NKUCC06_STL]MCA1861197.1 hypothetical protein [Janthinobacterium lividum]WFR78789.1 hypothetical protein P9875_24295 [Janthinobacterium rivuli]
MLKFMLLGGISLLLCGCASQLGTLFNRPVVEDSVDKMPGVFSLSADRRTVIFVTEENLGVDANNAVIKRQTRFCAEPPPDTANGIEAALNGKLDVTGKAGVRGNAEFDDEFETTVSVLADRTAALDAYRTGVYALCQYHLNGAIQSGDVKVLFSELTKAFVEVQIAQQQQTAAVKMAAKEAQLVRTELAVKNSEAQAQALMQTRQQEQTHQVAIEHAKAQQAPPATPAK